MPLSSGDRLGRYVILRQLGSGGMGEVYEATDPDLQRHVALKIVREQRHGDPLSASRFQREAKVLATLSHPNVLTIFDFGSDEDIAFLVTELLDGETLRSRLNRSILSWKEALTIGAAIAEGLSAAHSKGVIHRDLKPENIFLPRDGNVKVLDFGLAQLKKKPYENAEAAETVSVVTQQGTILGTLNYMSPEQLQGKSPDERSDIFSLGCILHEMITGTRVFSGESAPETIAAILKESPTNLSATGRTIPAELEQIIGRCLEKNPDLRFQSSSDLAFALKALTKTPEPSSQRHRHHSVFRWLIFAGIALIAIFVIWNQWERQKSPPQITSTDIKTLAVLPLVNLSQDPAQEYFTDGMTEELIAVLAKIKSLQVVSRTSVMQYRATTKSLPEIAKELRADLVLEGSTMKSGGHVRITAKLVLAASDRNLWAESYERNLDDVLTLQSEVAKTIAEEIQIQLTPQEREKLNDVQAISTEAHDKYLQGRYLLAQGGEQGIRQAMSLFNEAIGLDPDYAYAYAGLADAYGLLADYHLRPSETMPKAKEAALKALQLKEGLAEAHSSLAFVSFFYDYDWPRTELEVRRAIELSPSLSDAHFIYANYLASRGLHAEADVENQKVRNLDPRSVFKNEEIGWMLYVARRYDAAIEQLERTLLLDPNDALTNVDLALCYVAKNQISKAQSYVNKASGLSDEPMIPATVSYVYGVAGEKQKAERIILDLVKTYETHYICPYDIAASYLGTGETDKAFEWFEKAYADRSICMVWLKVDPRFDSIRSDPRYLDLLRRMAL